MLFTFFLLHFFLSFLFIHYHSYHTYTPDAITVNIDAAGNEFDTTQQQNYLKSASYGKTFCNDINSDNYIETINIIRVLNEIRKPSTGLPLTIAQLKKMNFDILIKRLILRNFHFLAMKICMLLKLKYDDVLIHWCCEKVHVIVVLIFVYIFDLFLSLFICFVFIYIFMIFYI